MAAERITVIAPAGLVCPRENGGGLIDDKTPVPVADSRYYRRMIAEKSLQLYKPQAERAERKRREEKE